jgi:hypothetical protein
LLTGYPSCRLSAPGCLPNVSFSQLSVIPKNDNVRIEYNGIRMKLFIVARRS